MDITMCKGGKCPLKEKCRRFTARQSMMQSYLTVPPFRIDRGKFICDMFWGDKSDYLFETLKSIMTNGKKAAGHSDNDNQPSQRSVCSGKDSDNRKNLQKAAAAKQHRNGKRDKQVFGKDAKQKKH